MRVGTLKQLSALFGTFLIQFLIGTFHTIPQITNYLYSYIIDNTDEEEEFPHTHFTLLFSVINLTHCLFIPIGIILTEKFTESTVTGIGLILVIISFTIFIFFPTFNYIATGFVIGSIGYGLAYLPSLVSLWSYFPKNKGFVTGFALTGFGINRLVFKYFSREIINPNRISALPGKIKYPSEISQNFRIYLQIVLMAYGILSVIAISLIQPLKYNNKTPSDRKRKGFKNVSKERYTHAGYKNYELYQKYENPVKQPIIYEKESIKDIIVSHNFIQLCSIFFLTMGKYWLFI